MTSNPADRRYPVPPTVPATQRIEDDARLDGYADLLATVGRRLTATPRRRWVLQGHWLGHALHPLLTDAPLGFWMSASTLDLAGGPQARPAAQRLLGLGVLAAVPTALTGLAELSGTSQSERRVAAVHAASNSTGLLLYVASLLARRRGRYGAGTVLALGGACAAGVGGYLGGHLAAVRKVSSRHPAFEMG